MIADLITIDNTIAFVYARKTKSGFAARVGKVTRITDTHVHIEETISPSLVQHRQFYKSAMMNIEFLS
jgi:hypothetical protein